MLVKPPYSPSTVLLLVKMNIHILYNYCSKLLSVRPVNIFLLCDMNISYNEIEFDIEY